MLEPNKIQQLSNLENADNRSENLDRTNHLPFMTKSAKERIAEIRPSAREDHLLILKLIAESESGKMSMNALAEATGWKPQNIHTRLNRLMSVGILARQKGQGKINTLGRGSKEYYYFFHPEIADEIENEIEVSLKVDANWAESKQEPDRTGKDRTNQFTKVKQPMNKEDLTLATSGSKGSAPSLELPKLPEYDDGCTPEIKATWFTLYQKILEQKEKENA